MLFQNVTNCPTNISDLLWQLTIKAVNDARSKKQTFQQEPRGRFSVQLLLTENRHVPDWIQFRKKMSCISAPKFAPVALRGAGGSKQHQNNAISFQGECSEANPWRVTLHFIKWTNRSDVIRSLLTDDIIDCCLYSCTISFIAEPFNQHLAQPDTLNYIHWIIFESYTCMLFCKPMSQTYYFRLSRKMRHKPCFDFFGCFLIFVDENVCFCFFRCPVHFFLYLIQKWGTFFTYNI